MLPTASPAPAGTTPPGRHAFVLWAFGAWTTVWASHFYALSAWWAGAPWAPAVPVLAWCAAIGSTVWTVRLLVRDAQRALAAVTAALAVLAAATVALTDWTSTYATVWFATHEAQFAEAADLAEDGGRCSIDPCPTRIELPPELRSLDAVDDELTFLDRRGDVALLATYRDEPSGGAGGYVAGFAHLPDGPRQWPEGSWGGRVTPRIELGGGWWWVD